MYTLQGSVTALNLLTMPQLLNSYDRQSFQRRGICCICGGSSCFESVDHVRVETHELFELVDSAKINRQSIDTLKQDTAQIYLQIRTKLIQKIEADQKQFQEWLNQYYYPQLAGKVNINLLCKLTERNSSLLPSRSLPNLIKQIGKTKRSCKITTDMSQTLCNIREFIEKINVESISNKPLRYLGVEYIANALSFNSLPSRTSISEIINPEYSELAPSTYQWKNIRINKNSRVVELSNKNLKDEDLIKEIPKIGCFTNLKELQVRNNYITSLSCRVIVNNLNFLHSLDIRGNLIGDSGIEIIAKGLPKLKSLFISETGATDRGGKVIGELMNSLELFWGQNNQLSGEVILGIANKPKLRVMSVSGNPISDNHKSKLHQLFVRKGYIVI